jgi:hypothetical protein
MCGDDLIYQQMRAEQPGPAFNPVSQYAHLAQDRAYRDMTDADAVPDDELDRHAAVVHQPLDGQPPGHALWLPSDYEAIRGGWDAGREDPR